ncbi:hypothetical protein [Nostoc sp. NMS4]|uniref:hypothetical protein n=1 Tax=Nostoc sp. NMS4 TaxID=2815390 RepID=UPI0025F38054|nr:hypothetical protein [Nostoc sp. NMS4]MBN3925146.1 hypothetical protein [Nostoc sp. NMS4]
MPKDYDNWQLETDKGYQQQKALKRYRYLKTLKKSELTLDDEMLIENFNTAFQLWFFPGTVVRTLE